jgi:hypothetical protein
MLVFQKARSGMGHSPYLGQAPAPAGPGPARTLAERNQSSASSYSVSFKVRDSGKAYPGMLAYRPDDPSLYALSARVAPSDMMMLYVVEGPGTGTWKVLSINDFRNNYRVVDEDEGIAIRNLAPATRPVGDLTSLDPAYPLILLSNAAITVADSFPTASDIDPAKLSDYYQTGLSGAAFAILLVNESLDVMGSAYDALRIGKNALNLARSVALEMATYLAKILAELQKGAGNLSEAVQNAGKLADAFMAKVPYWSLLLERASLWVQSTDLNKMTRYVSDMHAFDGMLHLALNAINQKSDELIKGGMTSGELVEAKAYIEKVLKGSVDADLDAQQRVQSYLDRNKMSKKDLERLVLLTDKFFDDNAQDIATLLHGPSSTASPGVSGLLGALFMGAFGQGPKPVLTEQLDIARAGRASVRAGYQSGGVDLSKGRPYIENTLTQLKNLATRSGYDVRAGVRTLGGKIVEQKPEDVITSLQAQRDLLESKKGRASVAELNAIKSQISDIEKALKIAETNSALLDPRAIERFNAAISKLVMLKNRAGANPTPEMLAKLAEGYVSVVLGPEGRELAVDLRDPKNRSEFLSFARDFGDALNLPENGLNTIIYGMVRRSLPGVEFGKGPVTESTAQAIVESLYNEAKTNISALEAKIASIYDPKMPAYISTANEADLMKALKTGTGPFAGSSPVQLAEVRDVVDNYLKTKHLMNALEARAMWPNGVIEEVGKMLNKEFSTVITSDGWKNEAKKLAEDVQSTRSVLRKVMKEYNDLINAGQLPNQELINSMTDAQKKYGDAFDTLKEKVAERKEYAGVYRLLRALEYYNGEVMERSQRARQAATIAKANPDPAATTAANGLVEASNVEVTNAAIVGDNVIRIMTGEQPVEPAKESAEKAAEATKEAEKADTTNALVSSANNDMSLTPIPEGSARPTFEELAPDRPENIVPKSKGTKLWKALLGLGALSVILGAISGAWFALGGSKRKDPKSHDPVVPPPSDADDLLKIGGVVGAIALLIYFLKKKKGDEAEPKPEKKKPVVARRR